MTQPILQRQQVHWDWRAAANFMAGGAGAGLLLVAVVAGARGVPLQALVAAGLALVGLGLFCVWLEIGRPLRALNVFLHPGRSWMSREALAALALFLLGAGLVAGMGWRAWPTALAAAAFLYCQARLLTAARGIPAWRDALTAPLLIATGIAEGAGLYLAATAWHGEAHGAAAALAALLLLRWVLWRTWRRRLGTHIAPAASRALAAEGEGLLWAGTVLPLGLLALGAAGMGAVTFALAGLAAAAAGASFKFTLVTRAGQHQGFTLPHLPVRGVPR